MADHEWELGYEFELRPAPPKASSALVFDPKRAHYHDRADEPMPGCEACEAKRARSEAGDG